MTSEIHYILNSIKKDAISKFDINKPYQNVIESIIIVDDLSNTARKEGLLAIEDKFVYGASSIGADSISYGVMLVVDGTDPELVAEIASNEYLSSKYQGNEALRQYILIRGLLAVKSGENPRVIEEVLISLLPSEIRDHARKMLEYDRDKRNSIHNKALLNKYSNWDGVEIKNKELKDLSNKVNYIVGRLSDPEIQRILREIEYEHVVKCLIYCSSNVRQQFLQNMSNRLSLILIDDMFNIVNYLDLHLENSKKSLQKVITIIDRLIDNGEIILH